MRLLVGACVFVSVGAIATVVQASIPDGNVIHGCYDSGGNVKVVSSLPCPKGYTNVDWNQAGPQGAPGTNGTNGVSVTSAALASGDPNCAAGGSKFTAANGTTYACNGAPGAQGPGAISGTQTIATGGAEPLHRGPTIVVNVSGYCTSTGVALELNQTGPQDGALQAFGTAAVDGALQAVDLTGVNSQMWIGTSTVDLDVVARDTRSGGFDRFDVHGEAGSPCQFWWMITPSS